jgi:hypothetical protein
MVFLPLWATVATAESFRWMSFEAIEFACKNRTVSEFSKGLCWGYVFGIFDEVKVKLEERGKQLCTDENDKDKVINRILAYVDAPKDKRIGADVCHGVDEFV